MTEPDLRTDDFLKAGLKDSPQLQITPCKSMTLIQEQLSKSRAGQSSVKINGTFPLTIKNQC